MEESQQPYSLDVRIPLVPNSKLIYNSFAFPICKLQRKSKVQEGGILAKAHTFSGMTASLKEGQNLRIQYESLFQE